MKLLKTVEDVQNARSKAISLMSSEDTFPYYNLSIRPKEVRFFDFDMVFHEGFFESAKECSLAVNDSSFSFVTLEPDPVAIYLNQQGWTACAEFDLEDKWSDFEGFVSYAPESKLEQRLELYVFLERAAAVSNGGQWFAYCSRKCSLGMFCQYAEIDTIKNMSAPYFMNIDQASDHLRTYSTVDADRFVRSWLAEIR